MMNTSVARLQAHPQVSEYKINHSAKESFELFYVLGKLETVRRTRTTDEEVTVYVEHGDKKGDAQFFVYPSTTQEQLDALIDAAVEKASHIDNATYALPGEQTGSFTVESNFADYSMMDLAAEIAETVFSANAIENGSLNAVEIFLNRYTETVINSKGLHKTQLRYDAMVEAIPTYNGARQSVELYEQYNFSSFDKQAMHEEIAGKMAEVKARYEAVKPEFVIDCPVVLHHKELTGMMYRIASDLNYASVYAKSNLFSRGDRVQKDLRGDALNLSMAGEIPGSVRSAKFDADGLALRDKALVENGVVVGYYGSNRFGQYLGEEPTGSLSCIRLQPGSLDPQSLSGENYLEIISMSGLQVDFFKNYIGGEVRLAYYHEGDKIIPVTGISITGSLQEVLDSIRLSKETVTSGAYSGPAIAEIFAMKVF